MKKIIIMLIITGFFPAALPSVALGSTLAYWRFDDAGDADIEQWGPVVAGNPLPDSDGWTVWRKATHDW